MPVFNGPQQTLAQSCGGVSMAVAISELVMAAQPDLAVLRLLGEATIYPAVSANLQGQQYSIPAKMVRYARNAGRASYLRESVGTTLRMRGWNINQHLMYTVFYLMWNVKYLYIPRSGISAAHLVAGEKALIACEIDPAHGGGLHYLLVRQGPAGITVFDAAYATNSNAAIAVWNNFLDGNAFVVFQHPQRGYKYLGISVVVA